MNIGDWEALLLHCNVRPHVASQWAPAFAVEAPAEKFSKGTEEIDDFVGQILHESMMLERLVENLNYTSAERICIVWPKRFPVPSVAMPYVRNPQLLANRVYGGRLGNTGPNDGWTYRGRGLIMVTGLDNYALVGDAIGIDLVTMPELLEQPHFALRAAVAWWEKRVPDGAMGDIVKVTKAVNGGTVGLEHRTGLTDRANEGLA